MRKTTNYGLSLYDKTDKLIITAEDNSLNANMQIIDNVLKEKATETYVNNKIANAQLGGNGGNIDSSGYATKDDLHSHSNKDVLDSITQEDINKWNNNSGGSGLTIEQINALNEMFKVCAYVKEDVGTEYGAFKTAFGIDGESGGTEPTKTLQSISAIYTGGNVEVGTNVNSLTGITVKANYSDGTSTNVTGYTLSGTILEGNNTITVSYSGKTATFTVVGVAESGSGDATEPLYGTFFPPVSKIINWSNPIWGDVENFASTGNSGQYIDAGLPAGSFIRLDKLQGTIYIRTLTSSEYGYLDYAYRVFANSDGEIATGGFTSVTPTIKRNLGSLDVNGTTYKFVLFEFKIPSGQTGYFVSQANAASGGYFVSADMVHIDEDYKQYYTLFTYDPTDRITEGATEVNG